MVNDALIVMRGGKRGVLTIPKVYLGRMRMAMGMDGMAPLYQRPPLYLVSRWLPRYLVCMYVLSTTTVTGYMTKND